jgi:hypothetical protein
LPASLCITAECVHWYAKAFTICFYVQAVIKGRLDGMLRFASVALWCSELLMAEFSMVS